jgi:hypothetical protein
MTKDRERNKDLNENTHAPGIEVKDQEIELLWEPCTEKKSICEWQARNSNKYVSGPSERQPVTQGPK